MRDKKLIVMVEIAIIVALAFLLGQIRLFRMPQGGSVSLQMVPILFLALRRGWLPGFVAGFLLGTLKLLVDPYIIHPVQLLFDYPLPYALLGLAGLFKSIPFVGVLVGTVGRFVIHFLSGVVFFGAYTPEGTNPLWYSALYNGSYLIPEMIIALVVVGLLSTRRDLLEPQT